jgi:PAS domain S-box-containing protein
MATAPTLSTITLADVMVHLALSPDAAILIDSLGKIVLVNEQAATLFGYDSHELNDQPLEVLLPERFHTAHVAHRRTYVATPRQRPMGVGLDLVGQRKDGSEFSVDISLRPMLLDQVLHVIGAIRDVTAQRLLERERVRLAERFHSWLSLTKTTTLSFPNCLLLSFSSVSLSNKGKWLKQKQGPAIA